MPTNMLDPIISSRRAQILDRLCTIITCAEKINCFYVAVFFRSVSTDSIEARVGYFPERFEAELWQEDMEKKYKNKFKMQYYIITNFSNDVDGGLLR